MASDDGMVRKLDVQGRVTAVWRHPTALRCMDVAPDRLVTGSVAGRASVWGWSGALLHRTEQGASVDLVAFAADGSLLATTGADRTLCLWDRNGRALSRTTMSRSLKGLRFSIDGSLLTIDSAGQLEIWRSPSEGSPA
jgi:WD40 repeat protein